MKNKKDSSPKVDDLSVQGIYPDENQEVTVEDEKVNEYLPSFIFEYKQLLSDMNDVLYKIIDGDNNKETLSKLYQLSQSVEDSALNVELANIADIAGFMRSALSIYGEETLPAWDVNLGAVAEYTIQKLSEIIPALENNESIDIDSVKAEVEYIWDEYKKESVSDEAKSLEVIPAPEEEHSEITLTLEEEEKEKEDYNLPSFESECRQLLSSLSETIDQAVGGDNSKEVLDKIDFQTQLIIDLAESVELERIAEIAKLIKSELEIYDEKTPPPWDANLGEIVEYTVQRLVEMVSAFEDDEFLDVDFAKMEIESIWIEYHNELVSASSEQEEIIEEESSEPVIIPEEEQKINKYLPSFILECKQLLVSMGDNLGKVVDGDRSDETFFELYRLAHSIGSSALTVELTEIADIARNMESALEVYEVYGEENPPQWDENLAPVIEYTALRLTEIITAIEADETTDIDSIKAEVESVWAEYNKEENLADTEPILISNEEETIEGDIAIVEKSSKSEELDSVVADFFKIEADEHLKTLQDGFLELEKNPKDEKIIEEVFRAAHTLKGAASTVGFKSTEIASHAIEDTLEPIRDGEMVLSPDTIDVLLGSLDALVETYKLECDHDPKAAQAANEVAVVLGKITGRQVDSKPAETQVFFAKKKDHVKREESVNVRLSKLDSLMNLAGELLVQQSRMNETKIKFSKIAEAIRLSLRRLAALNSDLSQQQLMSRTTQAMRVGVNVDDRQDSKYSSEFDELELDRYNELDRIVKNESEVHADLVEALFGFEDEISELAGSTDNLMQNVGAIQSSVISTRLIPLTQILDRFPRMVRDLARSEGKLIDLQIFGEDVEIDITVLRSIFDPMLHLVRNAVHHGIEIPEIREMIDKPKQGTISIDARYVGNQVVVEVSNDGVSLDTGSIAAEAVKMGIVKDSDLGKMTDDQINELIFLSGLSTSEEVGMVAGRGVGLDVVKNNIEAIGGSVYISSTSEKTSFILTLPISLVISQGIIVNISEHKFVIPLGSIQEVARIKKSDIEMIGSGPVVNLRGELLSVRYLDELLGIKSTIKDMSDFPALIIAKGSSLTVVAVSSIEGRQDIMIKKLPVCLDNIPVYSGVSIFGSGRVYPVLNVPTIISDKHIKIEQTLSRITSEKDEQLNILVVEDSLSMRKILKMDLENAGYIIHTASTGLEALDVIENKHIDGIILDIEMPEMDGYELMSVLKDEKNLAKIPKMIITSRAGGKHREKAFALGADAYLVKPYDRSIVLETLEDLVSD